MVDRGKFRMLPMILQYSGTGFAAGTTVAEVMVVSFSDNFCRAPQSAACAEAATRSRQSKNRACHGRSEYGVKCRAEDLGATPKSVRSLRVSIVFTAPGVSL